MTYRHPPIGKIVRKFYVSPLTRRAQQRAQHDLIMALCGGGLVTVICFAVMTTLALRAVYG